MVAGFAEHICRSIASTLPAWRIHCVGLSLLVCLRMGAGTTSLAPKGP